WLALPFLMFAIFLAALMGAGVWNIVVVFGLVYWTRYARVIRGEVLTLREREFVRLAQVAGVSTPRIIMRHILPNVLNTWMVLASLTVGVVIVTEASLSFLGVGVPPPTPAWGLMLAEARSTLMVGYWWANPVRARRRRVSQLWDYCRVAPASRAVASSSTDATWRHSLKPICGRSAAGGSP